MAKLFCDRWPLWLLHKILKRNPGYNMSMMWEAIKKLSLRICSTCNPMYREKALWTCNKGTNDSLSIVQHALFKVKKLAHLPIKTCQIMKVSKVRRVGPTCQAGAIKLINYPWRHKVWCMIINICCLVELITVPGLTFGIKARSVLRNSFQSNKLNKLTIIPLLLVL